MPPPTAKLRKPQHTHKKTASSGSSNWTAKNASRTAARESLRAEVLFRQRVSVATQTEHGVSVATQTDVIETISTPLLPPSQLAPLTRRAAPLVPAPVAAVARPLPLARRLVWD